MLAFCPAISSAADRFVALTGHIPKQIRTATKLGRTAADENVELSLVVRVDQALMDQTLAQIYGPNKTWPKRFLSPAEFAQKFDLAEKRQKLKDFVRSAGLAVNAGEDQSNSLVVKVSGPAGLVEQAFSVQLNRYRGADGQVFRAHETEPMVPASLVPHLNAVLGLSNVQGVLKPNLRGGHPVPARPGAAPDAARPSWSLTGTGPGGGLAPVDIKSIYGLSGILTGSGQTVALFELAGYTPTDITTYESSFGISPINVAPVLIDGAVNACGSGCDEVTLDIELVAALAPGVSRILVYEGPNNWVSIVDTYNQIAIDNLAKVVSTSWGAAEQSGLESAMTSESAIFQQMATQRQTIYAASGDSGAYAEGNTTLVVQDPAAQPYITGVGGTSLSGSIANHTETVWNDGCTSGGSSCEGSGGGIANFVSGSTYWSLPSYQSGVAGTYSQSYRNVPDVALNADPYSGYSIYYKGQWYAGFGGTSCAAPLWAALTALTNQQRAINTGAPAPLGFANYALYPLANNASYAIYTTYFNDITSGGNGLSGGLYQAGRGYDNATGWGSFKGDALIQALSGIPPPPAASPEFTNVSTNAITVNWSALGQLAQTQYTAQISTDNFNSINLSSVTFNTSATFGTGGVGPVLIPATAYYFRVQASSGSNTSAFSNLGSTDTLAAMPTSFALVQVNASSITVSWAAGTNPSGTQYRVDYWQATGSTFSLTAQESPAAVTNLFGGTTYYLTVSALNGNGIAAPSGIVLTTTTLPSAPVIIGPAGGTIIAGGVTLQIPAGAYSQDIQIGIQLPGSRSCGAASVETLTPTGIEGVYVNLNPDIEPAKSVVVIMSYQGADIGTLNQSRFVVAHCDPVSNAWVPLPSTVNAANMTVTAVSSQLSLFQLMQASPPTSVSQFKIGPNPLRPSRGQSQMNFVGPAGAEVRIFTVTGELIKDFALAADGTNFWDGTNRAGQPVATGGYFVSVKGGAQSQIYKVIVER
jgi:kumamolisin